MSGHGPAINALIQCRSGLAGAIERRSQLLADVQAEVDRLTLDISRAREDHDEMGRTIDVLRGLA